MHEHPHCPPAADDPGRGHMHPTHPAYPKRLWRRSPPRSATDAANAGRRRASAGSGLRTNVGTHWPFRGQPTSRGSATNRRQGAGSPGRGWRDRERGPSLGAHRRCAPQGRRGPSQGYAATRAEARLLIAQQREGRNRPLVATEIVEESLLDEIEADIATAQADIAAAKASIEAHEIELGYATVRAPIAGRIGRVLVAAGDTIKAAVVAGMAQTSLTISGQ